jgi:hypothetical protein
MDEPPQAHDENAFPARPRTVGTDRATLYLDLAALASNYLPQTGDSAGWGGV